MCRPLPNLISLLRLLGVPLFLWLVLGPEEDVWALVVLMVSGVTDFLDGWLARKLDQHSVLGQLLDPVADRLYILAVVHRAGPARRHPVVAGRLAAVARPAAVGPGAAAAHPRLQRAAGALPRARRRPSTCSTPSRSCCSVTARAPWPSWPRSSAGRFALWGIGLYWWAGILYAWQVRKLLATTEPAASPRPAVADG